MKTFLIIFSFITTLFSAQELSKNEQKLLNVDKEFAQVSREKGVRTAFENYLAENPTTFPFKKAFLQDRKQIVENYSKLIALDWVPLHAEISKSNDLGYTYGIGKVSYDNNGKIEISYSHYISIWKKNKKREWKLILNTGNDCSEELGKQYFK